MFRYLIFNKPYNVICQFTDDSPPQKPRQTLKDFINVPHVYSVGRLDQDSEGLLLLTNDGLLKNKLCEPKYSHARTYWVQVEGSPDSRSIHHLQQGVTLKNYTTKPAQIALLQTEPEVPPRTPPIRFRQNIPTTWLEMTLTEGKNRQIRHMTAHIGYPTLRLIRVAIGAGKQGNEKALSTNPSPILTLQGLNLGQWRNLTPEEVQALKQLTRRH